VIRRALIATSAVITLTLSTACARAATEITAPVDIGLLRVASPVASMLFARSQPTAVARTGDHKLRILRLPEGTEVRTIDYGDRRAVAFDFSPGGTAVAIGDWTGLVTVWSTATGQVMFERRLSKYPGILTFSPDGRKLATAAQGEAVQILDAVTGAPVTTLGSPVGGTMTLAFSRDGRRVATGDGDTVVRIHDVETGKEVGSNREFLMVPLAVTFSADGASIFAAGGDKFVTMIDAATGATTRKLERTAQPTQALDVSPDGRTIATIFMKSEDMTQPDHVVVRPVDTWQPRLDWLPPAMPVGGGWTSDGRLLVALPAKDGVQLWWLH
jgi:WD40 repeat protein